MSNENIFKKNSKESNSLNSRASRTNSQNNNNNNNENNIVNLNESNAGSEHTGNNNNHHKQQSSINVVVEENHEESHEHTNPNQTRVKIEDLTKVYHHKLSLLKHNQRFTELVKRLWDVLDKNIKFEISKDTFITVYSKILRFLLPSYNHPQINSFVKNEFLEFSHGNSSMNIESFHDAVFKLIHTWSTHINKYEYCYLLELVINRITRKSYFYLDGSSKTKLPKIKVQLIKIISKEDYDKETWDGVDNQGEEQNEDPFFDYFEDNEDENNIQTFQRPSINPNHYCGTDILIYNEDIIDERDEIYNNINKEDDYMEEDNDESK